ncbi:flagellar hook-basal body complex protein FliE [Hydrogenimonas urashimensis]|uniref:flagellar hook-basal body complex protein FliE n=1 Tax=Hydrogenimonas urashimensis TaxID=2740515 RepID=UPI001916A042|nr:flagellar hook-basal body complex protein FliE [Hydrogenimonas urashimensis]
MDKNVQGVSQLSTSELLKGKNKGGVKPGGKDFGDVLKETLDEVNALQQDGQKAMSDIATGQVKDLHQAAIAIDKAELSMKMMLEVRNKAINAYKEILRTQI